MRHIFKARKPPQSLQDALILAHGALPPTRMLAAALKRCGFTRYNGSSRPQELQLLPLAVAAQSRSSRTTDVVPRPHVPGLRHGQPAEQAGWLSIRLHRLRACRIGRGEPGQAAAMPRCLSIFQPVLGDSGRSEGDQARRPGAEHQGPVGWAGPAAHNAMMRCSISVA